jgi:hypothetical protein
MVPCCLHQAVHAREFIVEQFIVVAHFQQLCVGDLQHHDDVGVVGVAMPGQVVDGAVGQRMVCSPDSTGTRSNGSVREPADIGSLKLLTTPMRKSCCKVSGVGRIRAAPTPWRT